ncbi:hypothetical protein NN561_016123 [Cricetulus griseus]
MPTLRNGAAAAGGEQLLGREGRGPGLPGTLWRRAAEGATPAVLRFLPAVSRAVSAVSTPPPEAPPPPAAAGAAARLGATYCPALNAELCPPPPMLLLCAMVRRPRPWEPHIAAGGAGVERGMAPRERDG